MSHKKHYHAILVLLLILPFLPICIVYPSNTANAATKLAISIRADSKQAKVGEKVTWWWEVTGGQAPFQVWQYFLNYNGSTRKFTEEWTLSYTTNDRSGGRYHNVRNPGTASLGMYVKSADGQELVVRGGDVLVLSQVGPVNIPKMKAISIDSSNWDPAVGDRVTWTVVWSGGKPPYTVTAYAHLNDAQRWQISSSSTNGTSYSAAYTLDKTGSWVSSYKITSADGQIVECNGGRVTAREKNISKLKPVSINSSNLDPVIGDSVTWTVVWSGGKSPYTVTAYAHLNDAQRWEISSSKVNGTSYSAAYTLGKAGSWVSSYKITSADGQIIECNGGRVTAREKRNNASTLLAIAQGQVGSGGGTYLSWYNGSANYEDWCHTFVSWCANQAGLLNSVVPKTKAVRTSVQWYFDNGRLMGLSYTPKPGDLVFICNDYEKSGVKDRTFVTCVDHVAFVSYVQNEKVYTVGGNESNEVRNSNCYSLDGSTSGGKKIVAYGSN